MTDARVSRAQVEALVQPAPSAQVSRAQVEALVSAQPAGQVSRVQVEVLYLSIPTAGAVALTATSTLTITGVKTTTQTAAVVLTATATLTATGVIAAKQNAAVALTATSTLSATGVITTNTQDAAVVLTASATLTAAAVATPPGSGTAAGGYLWSGTGVGSRTRAGAAVGAYNWAGTGVGGGAAPLPVAGRTVRWTLTEKATGETWTMPLNPNSMTGLPQLKQFTTAGWSPQGSNRLRTFQAPTSAERLEWSGVILTDSHHQDLRTWSAKPGVIVVTDHLQRSFEVIIQAFVPDQKPGHHPGDPKRTYKITTLFLRRLS